MKNEHTYMITLIPGLVHTFKFMYKEVFQIQPRNVCYSILQHFISFISKFGKLTPFTLSM